MKLRPPHLVWLRIIAGLLAINGFLLLWIAFNRTASPQKPAVVSTSADPASGVVVKQRVPSPAPAIQASLWWNSETANRDLWLVNRLSFRWVKQIFGWREIEPVQKGQFQWDQADQVVGAAEAHDLWIIARLDREPYWASSSNFPPGTLATPPQNPQDFGDFCYAISSRYRGRAIKAYEVWNEPNLAREWGGHPPDPAGYVKLLAACSNGIRRGDPAAIVISAGLAPTGTSSPEAMPDDEFLKAMYKAGAAASFDMLGLNAPGYAAPPQASPDEVANTPAWGGHRWASFRHVEDMRQIMVDNGDGQKQVAVLEMGWTTDKIHPEYSWFAVTDQQQAEYLAGAYWWARLHWQPWIGFITTIYIADPSWTPNDEEYWWAITLPNSQKLVLRPAFRNLAGLPQWDPAFYTNAPGFLMATPGPTPSQAP
jgi:hypothetical protein